MGEISKGVLQSGENITREMFLSRLSFARDSIAKEWGDASGGGGLPPNI